MLTDAKLCYRILKTFEEKIFAMLTNMGPFTNYVMHFSLLFDHLPTFGYVFAILLMIYLIKFAMVIFC